MGIFNFSKKNRKENLQPIEPVLNSRTLLVEYKCPYCGHVLDSVYYGRLKSAKNPEVDSCPVCYKAFLKESK